MFADGTLTIHAGPAPALGEPAGEPLATVRL